MIVGPNGSGKSNLFDALQLLSRLAEMDLYSAFQGLRGNTDESFTKYPDGHTSERIRIAVEMLVDRKMRDDLGREFEIEYTRRLFALTALKYDAQFHGVLCLEEPENGVDPLHLPNIARLLRNMATDFDDPDQVDKPLRQVLITTHSPALISLPDSTHKAQSETNLLANHTLLEVRLNFPVFYETAHEYATLTRWFRKICDEAEMVAGPYAIDRLIEDTFTRCNI